MRLSLYLFAGATLSAGIGGLQRSPDVARLSVGGDVEKRRTYTNGELAQTFSAAIKDVPFTLKGESGHARAIPLLTLLEAARPKADPKRKNGSLAFAVVAAAADGYTVTFSAGELSPEFGNREVWLALDWNGQPLAGADAPARLIVSGDGKPARWVHGVRLLKVVNLLPKGSPRPATP